MMMMMRMMMRMRMRIRMMRHSSIKAKAADKQLIQFRRENKRQ